MYLNTGFIFMLILMYNDAELVKVKVEQGWLKGQVLMTSTNKTQYNSFKGIPYAAPPIGTLRFKAPQPPILWKGIRSSAEHGSVCVQQVVPLSEDIIGSENCLFLNVYSPNLRPASPLPVMFFIHGGYYISGSGNDDQYSPDFLMAFGIVLVTINYRLGALGFLTVGTEDVPGNAGMKDQIAAMRWVQKNIKAFGGDPNCVTIFGQSAGGASISLHIISPFAKGLFQRAISMSGTLYNPWTENYEPERRAYNLGRILGLDTHDPYELVEFLKQMPPETLIRARPNVVLSEQTLVDLLIFNYFTPIIEKTYGNGDGQYLTEHPDIWMSKCQINDVDLLIGHTAKEALFITPQVEKSILKYYPTYKQLLVPPKISYHRSGKYVLKLADQIQRFYFGNQSITYKTIGEFITFSSYFLFVYGIHAYIEKLPKSLTKKRFFYEFSIYSTRNVYSKPGAMRYGIEQATHKDDLPYLFDGSYYNLTVDVNSEAFKYIRLMCTLYTNFAKYGTPTPDDSLGLIWPEYDAERSAVIIGETGDLTDVSVSYNSNTPVGFLHQLYASTGTNTGTDWADN